MDQFLGGVPSQGMPNIDGLLNVGGPEAAQAKLPIVEQPIQDDISKADPGKKQEIAYAASAQVPVLEKPKEGEKPEKVKQESKTEEAVAEGEVEAEQGMEAEQEQRTNEDGGGQGGGQGSTGDDGGDGGSQTFTQGGQKPELEPAGVQSKMTLNVKEGGEISGSVKINTALQTDKTAPADAQKINPLTQDTKVTSSGLYSPPVNPAQFLFNADKMLNEVYQTNITFAASLPDGPEKIRFSDFLRMVQLALLDLQQVMRSFQSEDSKGAQLRSKAQLETTLAKIETQRKEQEEMHQKMAEAQAKMKTMGPLMAIFAFIMAILLAAILILMATFLLVSGPAGWMALALLFCQMIDQFAAVGGQKPFMMKKLVETIEKVTDAVVSSIADTFDLSPQDEERGKKIAKTVAVSLSMVLSVSVCPGAFVFGGFTALISFLNESHIVSDMEQMRGVDEATAKQAEMYVSMAIGVAFAIAGFGIALLMPPAGLGGAALAVTNALTRAAKAAAEFVGQAIAAALRLGQTAAQRIVKTIEAMMSVIFDPEIWVATTQLGLQTTEAVSTYKYQSILADIAIIQGRLDSEVELKETTIMILKKMIKQLLDGLQGIGDDLAYTGELLRKTHSAQSQVIGSLFA